MQSEYARLSERWLLAAGALSAGIGVLLGAFAAHGLKAILGPDLLATFEVGVRYQMYHAFGLVAAGLAHGRRPCRWLVASGGLFAIGTVLFSGSLYLLAASGVRSLGIVTPFGGVAFVAGWVCFVRGAWRA